MFHEIARANKDYICRYLGTVIIEDSIGTDIIDNEIPLGATEMGYSSVSAILTPEAVLYNAHSFELSSFSLHLLSVPETLLPRKML